jgi:HEAT repeat protein
MTEAQRTPLPADSAVRLTAFARACKGAARTVSLYPPEHPAIGEAMERLVRAAASATAPGPLAIMVLPDNLLVGGQATARPDAAIGELAALLHEHMVAEVTIQSSVEMAAWRTLLALLGSNPEDVRARGGLARALTTAGGIGIEITELDYSDLIRDGVSGTQASWEMIISACLQRDAIDLDEETIRLLGEIAQDATRLAEFFERTEGQAGSYSTRDRTMGLLRALQAVTGFYERENPDQIESVFGNMAAAVSRLSPDFVMAMLEIGRDEASGYVGLVSGISRRVTDQTVAKFVARSVAGERACTARLADAFRALAPDPRRQEAATFLAREELGRTPLGDEPEFGRLWSEVESTLLSYSDKPYIPEEYNQELASAQAKAGEFEQIADDPPERIVGWLTTVSDAAVRALDLQLLADLLAVVSDAAQRDEVLRLVVSQVDDLVALGDFSAAHQLVEALSALAEGPQAAESRAQVTRAIEQLVDGPFMSQAAAHLNAIRDDEFEPIKRLCAALGPAIVPKLAEALSVEIRNRARQRLTDLLISFGEHGRASVDRLRQSSNPGVRRTAVQLLRLFGGPEALRDLELLIHDPEPAVQRDAARALIGLGSGESFEMLSGILASQTHPGRAAVVEELGSTRDQKAAPLFCHLVRHMECRGPLRGIYFQWLGRLGLLGGPDAIDALSDVLRKGRWWAPLRTREIRTVAAEALTQIKLPAAQEALAAAAVNGSFGVRSIARKYVRTS